MPAPGPNHLKLVPETSASAEPSDDALMGLAAAGDAEAFGRLARRYQGRLRRFCAVLLRDEALARDAAQEVFLRVWQRKDRYRPEGRFRELLFTIAKNHCGRTARQRALWSFFGLAPASNSPLVGRAGSTEEAAIDAEARTLVEAAMLRLPDRFRIPLLLRFQEGMPYDEIARVIGRTPSAARSRIHYGLKELEALLPREVLE